MVPSVDILDDLAARFVLNVPRSEQEQPVRWLFHLQEAHWFYVDFVRDDDDPEPAPTFETFLTWLCPYTGWSVNEIDQHLQDWYEYCDQIPRCGGILLNTAKTHVLLVKHYQGRSWFFPMGKVNRHESYETCARREVEEETGYTGPHLDPCIEVFRDPHNQHRPLKLFVFPQVPMKFPFQPQTRNEIEACTWVKLTHIRHMRAFGVCRILREACAQVFPEVKKTDDVGTIYRRFTHRVPRRHGARVGREKWRKLPPHRSTGTDVSSGRSCVPNPQAAS